MRASKIDQWCEPNAVASLLDNAEAKPIDAGRAGWGRMIHHMTHVVQRPNED